MDYDADKWIVMIDQQKGLDNAIAAEIPMGEHRLCVKHLHVNWSKNFPGKAFKDLMWEAARAANVPYFEAKMEEIRQMSQAAYDALDRIDRKKWTRCAFRLGTNCPMLVNNWAEAFNRVLKYARDQPIIGLLSTMHQLVMTRLYKQYTKMTKWKTFVSPRVHKLIQDREDLTDRYITRFSGSSRYSVETAHHGFVVDEQKRECSCGLWQLGGVPCEHAICVYRTLNKDPRNYVHELFNKDTFKIVYSFYLEPMRGPTFWKKSPYPDIIPPDIRVLPGRPKKCRRISAEEKKEKAEKEKAKKAKMRAEQAEGTFKASRKKSVIHCKICGGVGHNARTCSQRDGNPPKRRRTVRC